MAKEMKPEDYTTKEELVWCPGCGNYSILIALKQALAELNCKKEDVVIVSGIGCSGKYFQYVDTYGIESIHGRALPVAMGIKLANNNLKVIVIGGDGDGYGIGMAHFVHHMRRNIDLTYIVCDNQIYGLTTGQTSPTSNLGVKTKSTPRGNIEEPVNPLGIALSSGATYIARGFSAEIDHLKNLIKGAIMHRGFSFVDIFQPCVTFNKHNTYKWFQERVYKLEENGYDPTTEDDAFRHAIDLKKLAIGLFYIEEKPPYDSLLPQIFKKPLVEQKISNVNIKDLLKEFY